MKFVLRCEAFCGKSDIIHSTHKGFQPTSQFTQDACMSVCFGEAFKTDVKDSSIIELLCCWNTKVFDQIGAFGLSANWQKKHTQKAKAQTIFRQTNAYVACESSHKLQLMHVGTTKSPTNYFLQETSKTNNHEEDLAHARKRQSMCCRSNGCTKLIRTAWAAYWRCEAVFYFHNKSGYMPSKHTLTHH